MMKWLEQSLGRVLFFAMADTPYLCATEALPEAIDILQPGIYLNRVSPLRQM